MPRNAATRGAQTSSASIQGTVSDDSGVLPGANVVARESETAGLTDEAF